MYSTIIQLETNPISEPEKLTVGEMETNDYYDWFFASVSDGVEKPESPEEVIEGFIEEMQYFGDVEVGSDDKGQWISFNKGFRRSYFEKIYPRFEEALKEMVEKANLDAFCGYEIGSLLYPLKLAVENWTHIYIKSEGLGLITLNDFVRSIVEVRPNEKYYIGGTIDYHF